MAVLLDTHVVLWYVTSDNRLSNRAREIIKAKTGLFFSMASLWEISIKLNIGKLQMTSSFDDLLVRLEFIKAKILPIEIEDAKAYISLPLIPEHRDPFDRLLVAQALNRSLILVSEDEKFDFYPIERIWK
ncbi:type II toxin-antitoxin system VapC family toxin [Nodosilinea sp. P-1105]|uniref:type II toxin-antitoxin system VapC family toxin n=1 Tax=Nodosilinea sp. P-1105 TaxID=2546229 RepID=UPI00146DE77A|nr:type II toxin-antitoxin system VapC family toxin [Nodosilinea sp. P-1105]NMF83251.1 type II toxin-antitoxin system VapC family toxin [Nodosilinea sp. P-1105]